MALSEAWPGVSGRTQARDIRNDLEGAVMRDGVFLGASTAPLLNKTSTMTPTVRAFDAAFRRTVADGMQLISNDGPTGIFPAFDAAPASGARRDLLVLSVYDTAYDATAGVKFEIVKGDASTGSDPQPRRDKMLANQMELGTLLIPAGATSLAASGVVWTDTYQIAALRGGPVWYRSYAEATDTEAALFPMGTPGRIVGSDAQMSVAADPVVGPSRRSWRYDTGTAHFHVSGPFNTSPNVQGFPYAPTLQTDDTIYNDFARAYTTGQINTENDFGIELDPGSYAVQYHFSLAELTSVNTRNVGLIYLRRGNSGNRQELVHVGVSEADDAASGAAVFTITQRSVMSFRHIVNMRVIPASVGHRVRIAKLR